MAEQDSGTKERLLQSGNFCSTVFKMPHCAGFVQMQV